MAAKWFNSSTLTLLWTFVQLVVDVGWHCVTVVSMQLWLFTLSLKVVTYLHEACNKNRFISDVKVPWLFVPLQYFKCNPWVRGNCVVIKVYLVWGLIRFRYWRQRSLKWLQGHMRLQLGKVTHRNRYARLQQNEKWIVMYILNFHQFYGYCLRTKNTL